MQSNSASPLDYLSDISAWVTCVQNQEQLPQLIVDTAAKVMQARASSLMLLDEDGQTLRFNITTGSKKNEIKQFQLKVGQGIAGHVAKTGAPLLVEDVSKDPRWYDAISKDIDFKTTSIACSPLKIESEIIGVLQIVDRRDGVHFTNNDLNTLTVFANVCAKAINNCRQVESVNRKNIELTELAAEKNKIIGKSCEVRKAVSDALKVANTKASVMVLGESGTGKELMARLIHGQSDRKDYPLVILNCGALTESLLEDELFGHEKGAYTGAAFQKPGKFELAHKGTLFLDEIGEMSLNMQTRLLRVLQEGTYYRVGGSKKIRVDVRVVSATNRDIEKEVQEKKFREDLYYRLNVVQIKNPPLRDRKSDILLLARYFMEQFKAKQARPNLQFSPETLKVIKGHTWPGNIRELKNAVERAVIMCEGPMIVPEDLPFASAGTRLPASQESTPYGNQGLKETVKAFKKKYVIHILKSVHGNRTKAAKILNIQRTYLSRLINELGIKGI